MVALRNLFIFTLFMLPMMLFAQPDKNILDMSKEEIIAERKRQVDEKMNLTPKEEEKFWPLYNEFQSEREKLDKKLFELVAEYANYYKNVTDEKAEQLLEDSLKIEEERIQLKRSFIKKFEGTLPVHKIATYIQIENKFWATVLYHLAVEVPLISR
ncbi:MAG: hypothetical protein KAI77_09045 [Gammaproteobacteria bacterium]|nr:hypothetical protein [Gammaproteobacteria bacterium]